MAKICHINTTFIYKAGSARRTLRVITALAAKGYQVSQVAGKDYLIHKDWNMKNIEFICIPSLVKYINPLKDIMALYKLYRLFRAIKPQLVHTHLAKAGILGRLAARMAGVSCIVHTVHGPVFSKNIPFIKRYTYRFLERLCGKFTDCCIFVGEELRNQYIDSKVLPLEKTTVIRNQYPQSDFVLADKITQEEIKLIRYRFSNNQDSFLIGYIARLVPSKAQDTAIHILKMLRDKGVDGRLIFVGEAHLIEEKRYEAKLRKLVKKLGLDEYVHFMGYQPKVFHYMKAMDVLVSTSRYEGLPNVAVEAGMARKPLVTFEVCGMAEIIRNNQTGYIIKQNDIINMTDKLIYLARNPEVVKSMGDRAYLEVARLYRDDGMIEKELLIYASVLNK
jgi:glycosyltransferase involved in cell wall biosynthesis